MKITCYYITGYDTIHKREIDTSSDLYVSDTDTEVIVNVDGHNTITMYKQFDIVKAQALKHRIDEVMEIANLQESDLVISNGMIV